jgi:hypothetical protein
MLVPSRKVAGRAEKERAVLKLRIHCVCVYRDPATKILCLVIVKLSYALYINSPFLEVLRKAAPYPQTPIPVAMRFSMFPSALPNALHVCTHSFLFAITAPVLVIVLFQARARCTLWLRTFLLGYSLSQA